MYEEMWGANLLKNARNRLIAAALSAVVGLPCGGAYAQTMRKLLVGDVSPLAATWPLMIAKQQKFFDAEKLDIEMIYTGGTTAVIQQLIGGSVDIAATSFESMILAADKGAPISMISGSIMHYPFSVMSAKDVHAAADMKGKRISLAYPQNVITVFWNRWLEKNGMAVSDVDQVYDGSSANRYKALQSGAVQAAAVTQPFDLVAGAAGYPVLLDISTVVPRIAQQGYAARKDWLAKNADTARAFNRAVLKGVAFFYDPANHETCVDILTRESKIDRAIVEQIYGFYIQRHQFETSGAIPEDAVKALLSVLNEINQLKDKSGDAAKYSDARYLPN